MAVKEVNPAFRFATLAIPSSILFILPIYTDPINLPKLLILIPITLTATVLFILLRNYVPKNLGTENKWPLFIYTFLGINMLISGLLGSQNYIRVFFGAIGRNNGLIYYVCVVTLAVIVTQGSIQLLELKYLNKVLSWTSLLFSAYCLVQYLGLDPLNWENPYNRVIGTLGNPNFSSSALSCFSIYWLYKFFRSGNVRLPKNLLLLAIAAVMMFLSWSTNSLQGLIVFALGAGLISFIFAREKWSSRLVLLIFSIGGGLSLLFLFISFLGLGPLGGSLEQYTLKLRGWYALFGIQAMLNSPWFGVGVDNYISAFRVFKSSEFVSQYGSTLSANNAHSTPVQIGSSFGVVVFLIYLLIQFWIFFKAFKILSSRNASENLIKGIALLWILVFSQSLLSIEIIGLGVLNWILGAIILSVSQPKNTSRDSMGESSIKTKKAQNFPLWTGPTAIACLSIGASVAIPISIEDRAFQNLAFYQVTSKNDLAYVVENYGKLSGLTLNYPSKLDQIMKNMSTVGLNPEIEEATKNLYKVEPDEAYSSDLMATYYKNTQQYSLEVQVREKLRELDPWNEKLELALAQAYSNNGDSSGLRQSIERLNLLSPSGNELKEAMALMLDSETSP